MEPRPNRTTLRPLSSGKLTSVVQDWSFTAPMSANGRIADAEAHPRLCLLLAISRRWRPR